MDDHVEHPTRHIGQILGSTMEAIPLSEATNRRIDALFAASDADRVRELLRARCGHTLPLVDASRGQLAERIRCAVLKLSNGNLDELDRWIDDAHRDWRDTLVSAGFANGLEDHVKWQP